MRPMGVAAFGPSCPRHMSKVSRVTASGEVLVAKRRTVGTLGCDKLGLQRRSLSEVLRRCREKRSSKEVMRVVLKRCRKRGGDAFFERLCSWVVCA